MGMIIKITLKYILSYINLVGTVWQVTLYNFLNFFLFWLCMLQHQTNTNDTYQLTLERPCIMRQEDIFTFVIHPADMT